MSTPITPKANGMSRRRFTTILGQTAFGLGSFILGGGTAGYTVSQ